MRSLLLASILTACFAAAPAIAQAPRGSPDLTIPSPPGSPGPTFPRPPGPGPLGDRPPASVPGDAPPVAAGGPPSRPDRYQSDAHRCDALDRDARASCLREARDARREGLYRD